MQASLLLIRNTSRSWQKLPIAELQVFQRIFHGMKEQVRDREKGIVKME
jgi:hypothetical protein